MTQPQRQPKEPFGISFLGLSLLLLGISAIAAIGIPLWFSQPRITLQHAAELLVQDIHNVQEHAVLSRTSCRIDFDADGGGYSAVNGLGEPLDAPMGNGPYRRDYGADAVFDGVIIESADFEGRPRLTFDRIGNATVEGSVVLRYNGEKRRVAFSDGVAHILD